MGKISDRRLVENEIIFRDVNKSIQEFVDDSSRPGQGKVKFYCECSDPSCRERIELTTSDYERIHRDKTQFITLKGHEAVAVEEVAAKKGTYQIVKKHFSAPKLDDIETALKAIGS